jgi:hypothetical protein
MKMNKAKQLRVDIYTNYLLPSKGNPYLAWAKLYTLGLTLKNTLSEQRKHKKLAR